MAYRAPHPSFAAQCPLVISVVDLDDCPRLITNIVGCEPEEVTVGMAVRADLEPIESSDMVLPVFKPA